MPRQLIAFCVIAVVFVAASVFTVKLSPVYNECINNGGAEHEAQHDENGKAVARLPPALSITLIARCAGRFSKENSDAITALATIVLTIATSFLVWVAYQQFITTRAQLRAYVMIDSVNVEGLEAGKIPHAVVTFKNSGATPAHGLTQWCMMGFDTFPHTGPLPTRGEERLPAIPLAPQGKYTVRPSEKRELNDVTIATLIAGTCAIYVKGEIRYTDAFGRARETDFLVFTGGPLGLSNTMGSYREGNRIT